VNGNIGIKVTDVTRNLISSRIYKRYLLAGVMLGGENHSTR